MAARTNPALSTFLDSMFLDSIVGAGTATCEPTSTENKESLPLTEAVAGASEPRSGETQTQEQQDAGSMQGVGSGVEEKVQTTGSAAHSPHHATVWPAHTNAIGRVIQAYNARTFQLEQECWELVVENKQLRRGLEADRLQRERLSELNLRLSCEVRRARGELATASSQAERLGRELRSTQQKRVATAGKLRLARCKVVKLRRSMRRSRESHSAARSQPCLTQSALTELQSGPLFQEKMMDEDATIEAPPGLPGLATIEAPPGLPGLDTPSMFTSSVQPCHCGDLRGNICLMGCLHHGTYSRTLMLAHHTLHQDISKGPPGLEQARCDHQNDYVASRLVSRRRTGALHRQPRL